MKLLCVTILGLLALAGCGSAKGNDSAWIQPQTGPNGEKCFIIWQGDRVAGGNCETH